VPKCTPHLLLPDAEYSIYLDGAITISIAPDYLIESVLGDADLAMFRHPTCLSIHEEYHRYYANLDNIPEDVVSEYNRLRHVVRQDGIHYCAGVIIRRHSPTVDAFGELWLHEHANGSTNDQFSLSYALDRYRNDLKVETIPGDPLNSHLFGYCLHASIPTADNPDYAAENAAWAERMERARALCSVREEAACGTA
jgi:hypothetical protein